MSIASHTSGDRYTTVEAIRIEGPTNTYNLLTASAVVKFNVGSTMTTFQRHDYIEVQSVDAVQYTMEAKAPAWNFSVSVTHPAVLAELMDPAMQSRPVQFWQVIVNEATGATLYAWPLFNGFINTNTAKLSKDKKTVDFEVVTAAEFLMRENEADRLTIAWQNEHFTGEKGLEFNTDALQNPYWGSDVKYSYGSSGAGNGGFIGGGGSYNENYNQH